MIHITEATEREKKKNKTHSGVQETRMKKFHKKSEFMNLTCQTNRKQKSKEIEIKMQHEKINTKEINELTFYQNK